MLSLILFLLACLLLQAFWIVAQAREFRRLERELTTWRLSGEAWTQRQKDAFQRIEELEAQERALRDKLANAKNGTDAQAREAGYWKESAENLNQQVIALSRQLQAFAERVRPARRAQTKGRLQ